MELAVHQLLAADQLSHEVLQNDEEKAVVE
jgi:hypothetical protein